MEQIKNYSNRRLDDSADAARVARISAYLAEREGAQALAIGASMDRRRCPSAPGLCEGDYEVLDR